MYLSRQFLFSCFGTLLLAGVLAACGGSEGGSPSNYEGVRSHLSGNLTVRSDVDTGSDFRDFEILVAMNTADGDVDTLGHGITDSTGTFALNIQAADDGIYPLIFSRRGEILRVDELVVTDGDSATIQAQFPMGNRLLRIRSNENAAWAAYKNTKAQYNNALARMLQDGTYREERVYDSIQRTVMIFKSMKQTFPQTVGSQVAEAEAVMMMGGWDDSLALAYALEIGPDNPSYANVGRVARQAQARLNGQEAALQVVRDFQSRADTDEKRAQLQTELVLAYIDSLQTDEARAAATELKQNYPTTEWAQWADRAIYELDHLMPGMEAPFFTATTRFGRVVDLEQLQGKVVLLEFFDPQDEVYHRELPGRQALYAALDRDAFTLLSVSIEPDTLVNEAFVEGRDFQGLIVFASGGLDNELARVYNVNVSPTRYLIGSDGKIVAKYVGGAIQAVIDDIAVLLDLGA